MALIVPEVFAELVREKVKGKVVLLNLAQEIGDLPEFATVGDTITFPKWKLIGNAEDIVKGTPLTPESLNQESSSAKIVHKGKAVRIYDVEMLTGLGDRKIEEAAEQTAIVLTRGLDDDLSVEAKSAPLKKAIAGATVITNADLEAGLQLFGDDVDSETFSGIVINSRLIASMMQLDGFIDKNKTTVSENNGVVRKGLIGYYRMIPIYVSDKGTYDSTLNECITFILKNSALGYKLKKQLDVEEEREAKLKATDIVSDMMYAVHLIDEGGCVVLRKTIA
jgi:hypothetical protein